MYNLSFNKNHKLSSGFTLIELITAIAIIGILSSIVVTNVLGVMKKTRDGQRKADLRQIQSALELYRADQGVYPEILKNCPSTGTATGLGNSDCSRTYIETIAADPLTKIDYFYEPILVGSQYLRYDIVACLENFNDPQIDSTSNTDVCSDTETQKSYTLKNP